MNAPKPRQLALERGENTYHTGKPCRNGHITARYTQSGTCVACLDASNAGRKSVARRAAASPFPEDPAWADYRLNQAEAQIRLYLEQLAEAVDYVRWVCVARWPTLPTETFLQTPRVAGRAAGTALYTFHVHAADVAHVEQWGIALLNARNRQSGPVRLPHHPEIERVDAFLRGEPVPPTPDEYNQADESWPEGDPRK